jgi:CubicO group peptidase (beta-lactamase class C family)
VTLQDLLAHCSGLTAHLPFYLDSRGRAEFEPAIATTKLEYDPRERALYSDLGFMLLGFVIEDVGRADLGTQFDLVCRVAGTSDLTYTPPRSWLTHTAPSGVSAWRGRRLTGEVHDDNCWALGGLAGHAGLFGTAGGVGAFARWLLQSLRGDAPSPAATRSTLHEFFTKTRVPGTSRALGWDTMLPTSSCGDRMSPSAVGHTGFTGTSLWIDWERDAYFVLLTNRTWFGEAGDPIKRVRQAFHAAAIAALAG